VTGFPTVVLYTAPQDHKTIKPNYRNTKKMSKSKKRIEIVNRRAKFEYQFVDTYEAGIILQGTEIKSIRQGNANLNDAYCFFRNGELYVKSMYIAEYENGAYANHEARRTRKLLLHRRELKKLERRVKEKGMTIVPYRLYLSERGIAKVEIALSSGKKSYDKRQTIKERDNKREMSRMKKIRL
jgi:SsrA-binding protein